MITLDFETRSAADLIKWGAQRYAHDTSTQALCLAWAFDQEEKVYLWHRKHEGWAETNQFGDDPIELIERIRDGEEVEAHNAAFEFYIWNIVLRNEYPEFDAEIKLEQLRCSAAKASCLSLPRALGDAVKALNLPDKKQEAGKTLIQRLSRPMAKRRVKAPEGTDAFETRLQKELRGLWSVGEDFHVNTAEHLAVELHEFYPHIKRPKEIARSSLQRLRDKEHIIEMLGDGYWRWTDVKPKRSRILPPFVDDGKEPPIRWNEDEKLHRQNWEYCKQDVRAERGLSNYCLPMTERELEYWRMDFRMNDRGIYLDKEAAEKGLELAGIEAQRLNTELRGITGGKVEGFTKRKPLLAWLNTKLIEIKQPILPNTKADTFSFRLIGVPTKAADKAKEVGKIRMDAEWAALGDEAYPIKRVMEIAMEGNKSSVAKYKRMLDSWVEKREDEPRLHDIMLFNGADRTGRWAGKGVQPHNFVRGYGAGYKKLTGLGFDEMQDIWHDLKHLDLDTITLLWGEPMVALAKACRGALIATPGKTLYAADFAAIEARKLAWLSGCSSMLDAFNTKGRDIYCDMASAIYKRLITKADKDERQLGKKAILGLGYAMGWEKFQTTVFMDEGIWLEDDFCKMVVSLYRKKMYPEVPALWKASEMAAIDAVRYGGEWSCGGDAFGIGSVSYFMDRDFLHCRLPSGRLLAYLYPEVHTRLNYRFKAKNARGSESVITFPVKRKGVPLFRVRNHAEKLASKQGKIILDDAPETFEQPHLSFMGRDTYTKKWKRLGTHGGTLVENYDQASSRDLLAEAMLRVDERDDLDILLSIHDEVVAEGAKGACTLGEFEAIMAEVPDWAPGMPIAAEGWVGERLRK